MRTLFIVVGIAQLVRRRIALQFLGVMAFALMLAGVMPSAVAQDAGTVQSVSRSVEPSAANAHCQVIEKPYSQLEMLQNLKCVLDRRLLLKEESYTPDNFESWFGGTSEQWAWVKLGPVKPPSCPPSTCGHFVSWSSMEELYQQNNKLIRSLVNGSSTIYGVTSDLRATFYRVNKQYVSMKLSVADPLNVSGAEVMKIFQGEWKGIPLKETEFPPYKWRDQTAMRSDIWIGEYNERIDVILEADRTVQIDVLLRTR